MSRIYTLTLNPAVDRELIVPQIDYDRVLRSTENHLDFGGKGFNVSRMLQSLGTPSTALGFVGGKSGELLQEGLESLGIQTDFVWIEGETRTNISIKTEMHDRYIKVNEPGPTISQASQDVLVEKISDFAQSGDWWVLAGSLPPGVPVSFYARLTKILQAAGAKVVLDTSGKALVAGCQAAPFLVKPNDVELQELSGRTVSCLDDSIRASQTLLEAGIQIVVVSLGKDGALLVSEGQSWLVKSPKIEEKNPIGAGDSMVGGLVWSLQQEKSLLESVQWGVACGAAAASLTGTAVGSPELVERLFLETQTEAITHA